MKMEFGKKYRDRVTGIEGVAVGKSTWITGCDTIGLQRVRNDEQHTDWFDIGRLDLVEVPPVTVKKTRRTGGPQLTPQPANRK